MVVDRVIYIKQSRDELEMEYFYYHKITGEKLSEVQYKKKDDEEKKDYHMIYFQIEQVNSPLISKYVLHCIIIIFSHILIFWFLPIQGNKNINNSSYCAAIVSANIPCNDFQYNGYIIFFYLIYMLYLIFSAIQIK